MRNQLTKEKLLHFLTELGNRASGQGKCYLTGGATALLHGWRETTIDVDVKFDPEPAGVFEAIPKLKNELQVNVELASPDQFLPEVPGWRERSQIIGAYGKIEFYHYDYVAQVLAKIERGHAQDMKDVEQMLNKGLVTAQQVAAGLQGIKDRLSRFPAIHAQAFIEDVESLLKRKL